MDVNYEIQVKEDVELNNLQRQQLATKNEKSRNMQILNDIVKGNNVNKWEGNSVDDVYNNFLKLNELASDGDMKAKAEVNAITTLMIQAPLVKRLNLFSYMGNVHRVGYNEELRFKVYQLQGDKSNFQATSGDFGFPTRHWRYDSISTKNITGGIVINYREIASGNIDTYAVEQEQVITDMMNKMFYTIQLDLYNTVKNASIKQFSEAEGINETAVRNTQKAIRRWGNMSIVGDYSVISQMELFGGFKTDVAGTTAKQFSEAVMEEIRQTGQLKTYYSHPVVEIPNTYNTTKLNGTNNYFETYLPEGLLYFLVNNGEISPLQIGIRGELTSMSGTDVKSGLEVTRFDMEFGTKVVKEYIPMIGIVSDSNFEVDKL